MRRLAINCKQKIKNQMNLLKSCEKPEYKMLEKYIDEVEFKDATNREGHAAKVYFNALAIEFDYDKNSIIEKLIEYIKVTADLLDKKLFIIINLDSFLTEEDLVELSKFLCHNEINVLALQNKITRQVKTFENLRILDQDLCEI